MATSVVVGSIFLATDEQFWVKELAVGTGPDLVNGRRVEVDKERTGDVFAAAGLGEECLEGAAIDNVLYIGVRPSIRAEAVLEKISVVAWWSAQCVDSQ